MISVMFQFDELETKLAHLLEENYSQKVCTYMLISEGGRK